jgi:hypothetical protein
MSYEEEDTCHMSDLYIIHHCIPALYMRRRIHVI